MIGQNFMKAVEDLEQARVAVFKRKWQRAFLLDGRSPRTRQEARELHKLMVYFAMDGEDLYE